MTANMQLSTFLKWNIYAQFYILKNKRFKLKNIFGKLRYIIQTHCFNKYVFKTYK